VLQNSRSIIHLIDSDLSHKNWDDQLIAA
jgi:hypothetical protein